MADEEFIFRGNLVEQPLPAMLATIHRHGVPGVMEVTRREDARRVYFIDGDVIFATSTDRGESLGDYLLREGRITKAQHRVSTDELVRSPGKRHGTILVQMGFLTTDELGVAVREQVQTILWNLFNWEDGQVQFKVGRFRDDEVYKIKIPTPRAVLSGCKRIADARRVTTQLGSRTTTFVTIPRPSHLTGLRLETAEQQLLDMVNGKRPLVELCEQGPLSPGLNARILYAFLELGLVDRDRAPSSGIRIQVRQG
jgi:hypothetical protein